jgi:hypothetical protein
VTPAGSAVPPTNLFVILACQIKVILGSLFSIIQSFLFSGPSHFRRHFCYTC